jgi:hypothetical protein
MARNCRRRGDGRWLAVLAGAIALVSGPGAPPAVATGDANRAACPNSGLPGFRAYLPDCRAYELVTGAFEPTSQFGTENVFEDSGGTLHVVVQTRGAVPGTLNNEGASGGSFDLTRGASSWGATPLSPAAALFPGAFLRDLSPESGAALYFARASSQPLEQGDFVRREPSGKFVEMGPAFPPSEVTGPPAGDIGVERGSTAYAGGARDLGHVDDKMLNDAERPFHLWPGDTTVPSKAGKSFNSLYEYAAGAGAPRLVGVAGGAGSTTLISDCGTNIGAGGRPSESGAISQDTYNAISRSADRVFFTAAGKGTTGCPEGAVAPPVSELFARVEGNKTVAISQPTASDCSACDTSAPAAATFQGASEDGSRVFFLTEQKLLPGAAGLSLYEYDFNGALGQRVKLVAENVLGVARIAANGTRAYFVTEGELLKDYSTATGVAVTVAKLSEEDSSDWAVGDERPVEATPDGRYLLFASSARLTSDDTSTAPQIFRYDAVTRELVRISKGQNGFNNDGNTESDPAFFPEARYKEASPAAPALLAMSTDGKYVVFQSAAGLTPLANNDAVAQGGEERAQNVYEYYEGNVFLISEPGDHSPQMFLTGITPTGSDVFFLSSEQLVPQDANTARDIYDARVEGGYPGPASPASCAADGCQGGLTAAPTFATPASATSLGGGNATISETQGTKPSRMSNAQRLASALRACHVKRNRRMRARCEAAARHRYGQRTKTRKRGR